MSISKKRFKELSSIPDSAINTSDIPELSDEFWKNAKLVLPETKKAISLRVDKEIIDWFKLRGKGYQYRMNAVLKAYVEANSKKIA